MTIYCFDIDGTLCTQQDRDYMRALPLPGRIQMINTLFDEGNIILIFTARGSKSGIDWQEATKGQLEAWGLRYHKLIFGKPHADYYIDDKAVHPDYFSW